MLSLTFPQSRSRTASGETLVMFATEPCGFHPVACLNVRGWGVGGAFYNLVCCFQQPCVKFCSKPGRSVTRVEVAGGFLCHKKKKKALQNLVCREAEV